MHAFSVALMLKKLVVACGYIRVYNLNDQQSWGRLQGGVVTMCETAKKAIQAETDRRKREKQAAEIRSICGVVGLSDDVAEKAITIHLEVRLIQSLPNQSLSL